MSRSLTGTRDLSQASGSRISTAEELASESRMPGKMLLLFVNSQGFGGIRIHGAVHFQIVAIPTTRTKVQRKLGQKNLTMFEKNVIHVPFAIFFPSLGRTVNVAFYIFESV